MRTTTITAIAALTLIPVGATEHAAPVPVRELTHIHGVVLPHDSQDVLLATHQGLFAVDAAGNARLVSEAADDFMGFTASSDGTLYASGHPASGGNIGVLSAAASGAPWSVLGSGVGGPVDFHAMSVSRADPKTLYGSYDGVQVSRDGGKTWALSGSGPDDLIDLAAAGDDAGHLYAGTMSGLFESTNFGVSWAEVGALGKPVSSVETAPDGQLRVFVPGAGSYALEGSNLIEVGKLSDKVILHMAFDPISPQLAVAVTSESEILSSTDGGKSWSPFVP